ncbi:hypothetical protein KR032_003404 [Drosophila birchii]|nr:hypothetical protein KR032_003404 [Drosophila birchii]
MDYYETSSADSEPKVTPFGTGYKYKAEISKFHATIATVSRNMRRDNWIYLERHPEIRAIIRVITTECINAKASNIHKFIADLFSADNDKDMIEKINRHLKDINDQIREGTLSKDDRDMAFPDSPENSSDDISNCPATKLNESANLKNDEYVRPVCPENFKPNCKELNDCLNIK